jgi:hypothetical protein
MPHRSEKLCQADRSSCHWLNGTVCAIFLVLAQDAMGGTLRVGLGETYLHISDVAHQAKDGDTVEILPGEYQGDVAVWQQKSLTIRGIGQRPVLIADGKYAEGKAIWVIRNGDFRIENIEFRGARVPDRNGAGIRLEHGRLHVRDCSFIDNQTGILTSNDDKAELTIENSRFAQAPRQIESLPHLLYVGRIAAVRISGSRFENGFRGHLIKSRARISHIHDSHVVDGPSGEASYEIDLPNGGIAHITGNTIGQSAKTQNPVLVSYGAEGEVWPENSLTLNDNVLINEYLPAGWFLRIHVDHFSLPPKVDLRNNRTQGLGIFTPDVMHNFQH